MMILFNNIQPNISNIMMVKLIISDKTMILFNNIKGTLD